MYGYEWTEEYGIYRLSINSKIVKEIRPVFKEELDLFGMDKYFNYPVTTAPLLWAEGIRRYILNGECIAEANGGGYYTRPQIKVYKKDIQLQPVNIERLWEVNESLMKGLEQKAIDYIREKYEYFKKLGYAFVVAFSGGKDSLVLLDLVSKALSPDEFYVVFNNTDMELQITLDAVEKAKQHWGKLRFYEAKSHMKAEQSWEEFGPPGRRMRWCCYVHKSVPTILELRELTGDYNVKAVVFDGVREEESVRRAGYNDITIGAKNINQVNCSPILHWTSCELFIYLLKNRIMFNTAYIYGFNRVGCTICPMSSGWRDSLCASLFKEEIKPLLKKVEQYTVNAGIKKSQRKQYIEKNGWRTRMGGRFLTNGGNRISEKICDNAIYFGFTKANQDWLSVAPLLGPIIETRQDGYVQLIDKKEYLLSIDQSDGLSIKYSPYSTMDRFVISHLRGVANKVAYCVGCKACMVECPTNAFIVDEKGKIKIRDEKCIHCSNCIDFTRGKGCLVAKSLSVTGGNGMNLKGMNRYQTFGMKKSWLEDYFRYGSDCFTMGKLGNRQYDSMKVWLRESGLLSTENKGENTGLPTPLYDKLKPLGVYNPLTWAIIWANLAYNSVIVKWYMLHAPIGEVYEKNDLVYMLGDDYSQRTRENAVSALLGTFKDTPIGSVLKQGIPIGSGNSIKYAKRGWETPDANAILYSLYLWAEATGRYTFSLTQLEEVRGKSDVPGVDPVSIYGLQPDSLKGILQALALNYEKYIRVTFVKDLDTVKLFPEIGSLDVLDLVKY